MRIFRGTIFFMVTCIGVSVGWPAVAEDLLLFGGDGHKEFLGCLNCSEYAGNSIWNEMSIYGWKNGFGTWNQFGPYKSQFSSYSACNDFASDPPVIVDQRGMYYGRLTVNEIRTDSVCSSLKNAEQLCQALKIMCADQ